MESSGTDPSVTSPYPLAQPASPSISAAPVQIEDHVEFDSASESTALIGFPVDVDQATALSLRLFGGRVTAAFHSVFPRRGATVDSLRPSFLSKFAILSGRTFRNIYRNPFLMVSHYAIALIIGGID